MTEKNELYRSANGSRIAVAAGCPEAVEAAVQTFERGGNIVDAAAAGVAAAWVTMPHMTSIGGELFAIVSMGDDQPQAVLASGMSGMNASISAYKEKGLDLVPKTGGLSVQTPAAPCGLEHLVTGWGSMSLPEVLGPAIGYAKDGFRVSGHLAKAIQARQSELKDFSHWQSVFCPGDVALAEGALLTQKELAKTLELFARGGAQGLLAGEVGDDIIQAVQRYDGLMVKDDLLATNARTTRALSCTFGGLTVYTQPPVSQGFVLARALALLEMGAGGNEDLWVAATCALQQAFSERVRYLSDAPNAHQIAEELLAKPALPVNDFVPVNANPSGDTTVLSVIDDQGNAVTVIHSIFDDFGSGVMAPASGIILNNRLSAFFLDENYPNHLAPRKRSMHTLHSFLARDEHGVKWTGGSPGADHQPQVNTHVLLGLLYEGLNPAEAISRARWSVHPGSDPCDIVGKMPPYITSEPGVDARRLEALRAAGYDVRVLEGRTLGSSKLVGRLDDGSLGAWVDCRRNGAVGAH